MRTFLLSIHVPAKPLLDLSVLFLLLQAEVFYPLLQFEDELESLHLLLVLLHQVVGKGKAYIEAALPRTFWEDVLLLL